MMGNDIPLEAVLKYIKRDRDRLQEKLDKLTKYAKQLESERGYWDEEITRQKQENDLLREENQYLRTEVKSSALWQNMKLQLHAVQAKNKELQAVIERLYAERRMMEQGVEPIGEEGE